MKNPICAKRNPQVFPIFLLSLAHCSPVLLGGAKALLAVAAVLLSGGRCSAAAAAAALL